MTNREDFMQQHDSYINERVKDKKIAYVYTFNWRSFTYNWVKSDCYSLDVTIRFNTHEFEENHSVEGVTDYLSASIDLEETALKIKIDDNSLFKTVQIFELALWTGVNFIELTEEEGKQLIKEYCKQAKANQLSYVELSGSPVASFSI